MSAIDGYLRDLRGRLPLVVRSRVPAEVEDHGSSGGRHAYRARRQG